MIPQMFDVKPVAESGNIDVEKISKLSKMLVLPPDEGIIRRKKLDNKKQIKRAPASKFSARVNVIKNSSDMIVPPKAVRKDHNSGRVSATPSVNFSPERKAVASQPALSSDYRKSLRPYVPADRVIRPKRVAAISVAPVRQIQLGRVVSSPALNPLSGVGERRNFDPPKQPEKIRRSFKAVVPQLSKRMVKEAERQVASQCFMPLKSAVKQGTDFQNKRNFSVDSNIKKVLKPFEKEVVSMGSKSLGSDKLGRIEIEGVKDSQTIIPEKNFAALGDKYLFENSLAWDQSRKEKEYLQKSTGLYDMPPIGKRLVPKKGKKSKPRLVYVGEKADSSVKDSRKGEISGAKDVSIKEFSFGNLLGKSYLRHAQDKKSDWKSAIVRPAMNFAMILLLVSGLFGAGLFISRGVQVKDAVLAQGKAAIGHLALAKDELTKQNFDSAQGHIQNANDVFLSAKKDIDSLGGDILDIFSNLSVLSRVSSGKNLIEAGQKMTEAAAILSKSAEEVSSLSNPFSNEQNSEQASLINTLNLIQERTVQANAALTEAQSYLDKVELKDVPAEYQEKLILLRQTLPMVVQALDDFQQNYQIFLEILGHNGPRKYLFLFQNNQEMRATGGFIGSYGLMDVSNGSVKNLYIDGIYNPDGQLKENVVPPQPIQKISAAWSTHDANWFPHFPTSAKKVAWFYEKTGGPTVDGIISLTPTVLQKMLEITGPIEMPEYETTVDKDNFVKATQFEVEVDYDKEQNRPKQFIADLAPKILDKVFTVKDPKQISMVLSVLASSLKEKHILIYSVHPDIQNVISQRGWSGEILNTSKDYLMVVNSNINGFKTDGIIEETITHKAQIQQDGSIINTVRIKRVHNGGDSDYEWWNKVNPDYMRVYVPKGSTLLEVSGQTRETSNPPLDYDALGFRRDEDVEFQEKSMTIDEQSGTTIYEEEGKTVFANWVYVSPKETVEIEYKYKLPFKIDFSKNEDMVDSYSLLVQKQSGSVGSSFSSEIILPMGVNLVWKYPELLEEGAGKMKLENKLVKDTFLGFVMQDKLAKELAEQKK